MRVLVVDDSAANRKIARVFLEREGNGVTEAGSGQEALDLLAAQEFDVVLMDIAMPDMDGLEATRRLRRMGGTAARTPVVAWTAHDIPGMRLQSMAAGVDGYLTKPIQRTPLVETLQQICNRGGQGGLSIVRA
ncbi:MAG: response regulator [Pseudomonadota bacterium]|nr:response regulator [Pseudomonadota bacterium]